MIVVLNHKSNLTKDEFINYYKQLETLELSTCEIVVCPSFPNLALASPSKVSLGAQNVSKNPSGAHTGEISAEQLKSYGVKYAIVGHSERRFEQHETSDDINSKVQELLKQNITPIVCIGETKEEKNNPNIQELLMNELFDSTKNLSEADYEKLIIAYEPIWSIGTGILPTNEEIELKIRCIKEKFPTSKVLYGGSVNEKNIAELIKNRCIDGFLIGGLSLEPDKLKIVIETVEKSS